MDICLEVKDVVDLLSSSTCPFTNAQFGACYDCDHKPKLITALIKAKNE